MASTGPLGTFKREALPHDVAGYEQEARARTLTDFVAAHPHPFLLYAKSVLWDPALVQVSTGFAARTMPVDYSLFSGGRTFLSPIKKVQSDPRLIGVWLGRSVVGNDVVVPVSSISTKHARFMPPGSSRPDVWCVVDLKSSNKTYVGEEVIAPETPVALDDGGYLRLGGNLIAWFLSPSRLWQTLRAPEQLARLLNP